MMSIWTELSKKIAINRDRVPNENDKKIQTLTARLESGELTPLAYVKAIAHLKSKIKGGEDVDSDSDSEAEEGEKKTCHICRGPVRRLMQFFNN